MTNELLTPAIETEVRNLRGHFPYRIIYVARHPQTGEHFASAVTSMRIPNKLAREGWQVARIN